MYACYSINSIYELPTYDGEKFIEQMSTVVMVLHLFGYFNADVLVNKVKHFLKQNPESIYIFLQGTEVVFSTMYI